MALKDVTLTINISKYR